MSELSPSARRLLALDAAHGGPTEDDAERVRRAVLARVLAASAAAGLRGSRTRRPLPQRARAPRRASRRRRAFS